MSSNAIGTVFRIIGIFFSLITIWYIIVALAYFTVCFIGGFSFSLATSFILLGVFLVFRMFYPKNVFV